ncbi:Rab GTPase-binding effector protein 1 [Trichinella papuae]|uniref:Rab GTPase-binding effector protein 1 n=1 Tax=Trichinella papuae TaxID=268474 RepID=A0A0V1MDD4_9BILA|nr:Rab GTPase-binding effector protein 1 [Trichinella papuae]
MNNHYRSLSCSNLSSLRTEEATDEMLLDCRQLWHARCAPIMRMETERRLRQQLTALQNLNERYKSELSAARLNHKELDNSVNEMMDKVSKQLTDLRDIFKAVELRHTELEGYFKGETTNIRRELSEVIASRRKIEDVYQTLSDQYDHLLGRHRQGARQLEEEKIDLPQDVEELQLLCLQLKEELIETRTAKEHLEETLMSEIVLLKAEIASEKQAKEQVEASLADDICHLRSQLDCAQNCLLERESLYKWKAEAQSQFDKHRRRIFELESHVKELEKEKLQAKELIQEGQRRAQVLQQELDNCVQVQRDFVKLSQSLQIQLEKIRQSEHEVRWEDDDDVLMCRGCKQLFNRHRRKLHCRHCGRIFCDPCLSRTVSSGPQRKPAKVCEVCHTLLVSETAPYFSVEVPHSQLDGA